MTVRPTTSASSPLYVEANHRITNQLAALASMAQLRTDQVKAGPDFIPRAQMLAALNDFHGTIMAIAHLHRALTEKSTQACQESAQGGVGIADLLTGVLRDFAGIYRRRLRWSVDVDQACTLEAPQASVLVLAFAEIVSNAMKYAHPTGLPVEIAIRGEVTPTGIALRISDDGVGLPEAFDEERHTGLGFKLMRGLIASIDGLIDVSSTPLGLVFSIALSSRGRAAEAAAAD